MINHVRTLLADLEPVPGLPAQQFWELGEEIIDPNFRPSAEAFSTYRTFRTVVFGTQSQRLFRNLRLFQILEFLHVSPLAYWLEAVDPRITYRATSLRERLAQFRPRTEIQPITNPPLLVLQPAQANESQGICEFRYSIDSSVVPPGEDWFDVIFPDSSLQVRVPNLANQSWTLYSFGQITYGVEALATQFLERLQPADIAWLFPSSDVLPREQLSSDLLRLYEKAFAEFSEYFSEKSDLLDRFAASTLALAYRLDIEQIRIRNHGPLGG